MLKIGVINKDEYGVMRNVYKRVHNGRCAYFALESLDRRVIHKLGRIFNLNVGWQMSPGIVRSIMLDRSLFYVSPFADKNLEKVDLIHAWNQTCKTDKPWIVSLETKLPHCVDAEYGALTKAYTRYTSRRDLELIRKENCRKIICFCQNTYNELETSIKSIDKSAWDEVKNKTTVLIPPQRRLIGEQEIEEKFRGDDWRLVFIGGDFWIKGGVELILALKELRKKHDFTLTLVSTMEIYHQMVHNPYYSADEIQTMRDMVRNEPWIQYHSKLDNRSVLKIMKRSHIGLFPSYGDTFGYVTLEMQASGCPVITTDINALPEINNNEVGWICNITGTEPFEGVKAPRVRAILQKQIADALDEALSNRDLVIGKAVKAANRVEREFSEDEFSSKMYEIYSGALSDRQKGAGR